MMPHQSRGLPGQYGAEQTRITGGTSPSKHHTPWMYYPTTKYNQAPTTPPAGDPLRRSFRGKYTRTPPPRLPNVKTPPHHEPYKSAEDLRGSYYERVPPVYPRVAFERSYEEDLDNWGDESESANREPRYIYSQPYSYALPYSYGVRAPGPMFYPTMMVPYPTLHPHHQGQPPDPSLVPPGGDIKKVRYAEDYRKDLRNKRTPGGATYNPRANHHPIPEEEEPQLSHITRPSLGVTNKHFQYLLPGRSKKTDLDQEAWEVFQQKPQFAREVVDSLITEVLEDELIPDILIQVLSKSLDDMSRDHPYYGPSFDVALAFLQEEVPRLVREVVMETTSDLVKDYLRGQQGAQGDLGEEVMAQLIHEVVVKDAAEVVRDAVHEMAQHHLNKAAVYDVTVDVIDELIRDLGPELISEAQEEVRMEEVLEEVIYGPVLDEMVMGVTMETMAYYSDKARQQEFKEIMKHSQKQLLDTIILDHLLETMALTGTPPGEAEEEAGNQLLDDIVMTILLEQYMGLLTEPQRTLQNAPCRRHHERAFTEVAVGVLTTELCGSLDEDLADFDDYEQGLWNPSRYPPPDWAVYTIT